MCGPPKRPVATTTWRALICLRPVSIGPIQAGDPPDTDLRIDFCPPVVQRDPSTAPVLPMQSLGFFLAFIQAPTHAAAYTWHAVVTPVPGLWVSLFAYSALYVLLGFVVALLLAHQFRSSPGPAELARGAVAEAH